MKRVIFALAASIMLIPVISAAGADDDLCNAIKNNDIQKTRELISRGAAINAKNSNGRTPLMEAAVRGYTETAKFLIGVGADINAKSNKGETALSLASSYNNDSITQLIKKAEAR